jgi:non-homologous end joining protein Ku
MRPYWKGYLKLALVSCPIALHAACSTAERIAFRQINTITGRDPAARERRPSSRRKETTAWLVW